MHGRIPFQTRQERLDIRRKKSLWQLLALVHSLHFALHELRVLLHIRLEMSATKLYLYEV